MMKKMLPVIIAAAVLLTVVIVTAGCIAPNAVVGTWTAQTDDGQRITVFNSDGTGSYTGPDITGTESITWKNNRNNTFTITYEDKTTEICTFDPKHDTLKAVDGVIYTRQVSDAPKDTDAKK